MSMNEQAIAELANETIAGFTEEAFALLPEPGNALLRGKREEALAAYLRIAAPTGFDEEWRKTDPSLFRFDTWCALPIKAGTEFNESAWDDAFDVVVQIEGTSVSIQDRSGVLKSGQIYVASLHEAAERYPERVQQYLQGAALPATTDKFTALNGAFWNVGLFIHIPANTRLGKGVFLRFRQPESGAVLLPRLVIVAEPGSEATVVERLESEDDVQMGVVSARELYVDAAARLKFITLQEWGRGTSQIGNDMAVVQRDAQVDWITLNLGSRVSKLKFGSDVAGTGSSAELDGVFLTDEDQHIDQTTLQIHSAPHTYSRLLYKGAVVDQGHSIYRGIIQAKPGAIKVDAYQTNNNLVLSDGAMVDTIPGLLIDADDLKCSHGATIGNLDPDQVFYLRARGIPEHEARKLLLLGFYDEILDRIPFAAIRDRVHELLVNKLDRVL